MSETNWPPAPDLGSIQELVRAADPEGHLEEGAPADEYEPEEQAIYEALKDRATADLLASDTLPLIETVWRESFHLNTAALSERRPMLLSLAKEIERFFGPDARPRTREQIIEENKKPSA